jgi:CrcB protein
VPCAFLGEWPRDDQGTLVNYSLLAVFGGAGLGACPRWWLGTRLNPVFPTLPLGTLAANLVGGFLVGVAVAYFARHAALAPEVRLFVITGFMGGLTTFSTFSSEVVGLLGSGQVLWAVAAASTHLIGSLALTALGMLAAQALVPVT